MKEYYIFNVKKEFYRLYKENPSELFYIFNRIYYMKEIDKMYGYNLFEQICNFFNKKEINDFLFNKYKDKIIYSYTTNEHIINNLYYNEISILKVKSSNIKIETNLDNCTFLNDLKEININLFICNFKEQDFYFLKAKEVKVKSS